MNGSKAYRRRDVKKIDVAQLRIAAVERGGEAKLISEVRIPFVVKAK